MLKITSFVAYLLIFPTLLLSSAQKPSKKTFALHEVETQLEQKISLQIKKWHTKIVKNNKITLKNLSLTLRKIETGFKSWFGIILPDISLYAQNNPQKLRLKLSWPVKGNVVERFGIGRRGINNGITIRTAKSAEIHSVAPGTIAFIGQRKGYGLMVMIRHANNIYSVYTNMDKARVHIGQKISRGFILGWVGKINKFHCYGLHFELYYKNKPVNPAEYLS